MPGYRIEKRYDQFVKCLEMHAYVTMVYRLGAYEFKAAIPARDFGFDGPPIGHTGDAYIAPARVVAVGGCAHEAALSIALTGDDAVAHGARALAAEECNQLVASGTPIQRSSVRFLLADAFITGDGNADDTARSIFATYANSGLIDDLVETIRVWRPQLAALQTEFVMRSRISAASVTSNPGTHKGGRVRRAGI